jgi:hypothetical protein
MSAVDDGAGGGATGGCCACWNGGGIWHVAPAAQPSSPVLPSPDEHPGKLPIKTRAAATLTTFLMRDSCWRDGAAGGALLTASSMLAA